MKGVLIFILVVCLLGYGGIASHMSKDSVVFTVTGSERIVKEDSSYYLVFTDKGAFKNEDDWWQLKFSSSDLQSKFKVDTKHRCTKNFWRVQIFSMYENLIECKQL